MITVLRATVGETASNYLSANATSIVFLSAILVVVVFLSITRALEPALEPE